MPPPSIKPDSISSVGMPVMNWRMRKQPKALVRPGIIRPEYVSTQFICDKMINTGMIVTCEGTIIVPM